MPDWHTEISRRLASLQLGPTQEALVSEELTQYLDEHYRDLLGQGVPDEQARETVLAGFDDCDRLRELHHFQREGQTAMQMEKPAIHLWQELRSDIRFGLRMLRKNPGFAAVAILTLAIGLGANTAVFSLVDKLLLRPFYPDLGRMLVLQDVPRSARAQKINMTYKMSYPKYLAWKDHKDIFEDVAALRSQGPSLTGMGEPERLRAALVTSNFLPMLGISPMLGRDFRPDEQPRSAPPVVLLSYAFWRSHFNSDRAVIGRKVTLDDRVFTVIGVLPEDARMGSSLLKTIDAVPFDVIEPLRLEPEAAVIGFNALLVIGKVRADFNVTSAISAIQSQVKAVNEQFGSETNLQVIPLETYLMTETRPLLLILLGAVAAVLLITSANTANLLLARGASREKEIAIRLALGASRGRLVRQMLTESLLISILGTTLGVAGLAVVQTPLTTLLSDRLPPGGGVHIDTNVLLFALVLCLLTAIVFGVAPALQGSRQHVRERLNQGGRSSSALGSQRTRNVLVVAEIAFSLVLLAAAGLLLRSFVRLINVDTGFESDHVITMRIWPPPSRYADPHKDIAYLNAILQHTSALPGVQSAGFASNLPLSGFSTTGGFGIQGRPFDPNNAIMGSKQLVAGDYFRAMNMRLLRGRVFTEHDTTESSPVAIIDQEFARQYFGDEDPVGKHLNFAWGGSDWCEIVGVVGGVREIGLATTPLPTAYVPLVQRPALLEHLSFSLAVRTRSNPADMARPVREVIHQLDSAQIIEAVRTMDQVVDDSLRSRRAPMWLFSGFGGIALFLAAIGVYGVLSYYVTQRREEIGTRLALGAQRSDILWLILGHAGKLIGAGLACGAIVTYAATRMLTSQLYGTEPTDTPTLLTVSGVLAIVAMLACAVPAFRATRVDPQVVLRSE